MGKAVEKLALAGGRSLRAAPFPDWPRPGREEARALSGVLKSGNWGGYPFPNSRARAFAAAFARAHDAKYGVCAANGTVTLEVALRAAGVGPGDEVIVPAFTFEATAAAAVFVNAVPVFVDIDPDTYCIDPAKLSPAITPKTKAVILVHLGMSLADLDAVLELARPRGIAVIEDCAHAHGGKWRGRGAGSWGDLGSFSFQTSKLMTAGEGGILITSSPELWELCQSYVNCGRRSMTDRYKNRVLGANFRMTEFQAAVLLAQLDRLEEQTARRAENARYLSKLLSELGLRSQRWDERVTTPAIYQYVFRYDAERFEGASRDAFVAALEAEGVPCEGLFYEPVYRSSLFHASREKFPFLRGCSFDKVSCPVAEKAAYRESVWLHHRLLLGTRKDVDQIAEAILKIQRHAGELARLKHPKIAEKILPRGERA